MLTVLSLLLAAAVGAVANRIRGGALGDRWGVRGQTSRSIYAALMTGIVLCAGNPWPVDGWRLALLGLTFVAAWFLGAVAFPTFSAIDAGRVEGERLTDGLLGSLRGALYTLPPAAVLAVFAYVFEGVDAACAAVLLPACGSLQGVLYEAAWAIWPMAKGHKPTEIAEMLTGAAMGLGAAGAAMLT